MSEFLEGLEFWHWLVLGVVLAIIEVFAPGAFFLWLGISAGHRWHHSVGDSGNYRGSFSCCYLRYSPLPVSSLRDAIS